MLSHVKKNLGQKRIYEKNLHNPFCQVVNKPSTILSYVKKKMGKKRVNKKNLHHLFYQMVDKPSTMFSHVIYIVIAFLIVCASVIFCKNQRVDKICSAYFNIQWSMSMSL